MALTCITPVMTLVTVELPESPATNSGVMM